MSQQLDTSSVPRQHHQGVGGRRVAKPWIKAQFDEASSACKHCRAIVGDSTSSRKRVGDNILMIQIREIFISIDINSLINDDDLSFMSDRGGAASICPQDTYILVT